MFSSNTSQVSSDATYIEDVFSTYLYTGNGSTQTITNGIDLAGKGGLVWTKIRSAADRNALIDSARGINKLLNSDATFAQATQSNMITALTATGYTLGTDGTGQTNLNNATYASWTFRKAPKFFDVVTYTGNGSNRTISHSLGSVPGCIIIKRTDTTGAWAVYHRSLANTEYLVLNTTAAKATGATYWNSTTPTSTVFSLGTATDVNANTGTYVAYLFAHDAGGFGTAGTDNVISCGSYTGDGGAGTTNITLGYEPQWIMSKRTDAAGNWVILDVMRGLTVTASDVILQPNTANAEGAAADYYDPTATGFKTTTSSNQNVSGATYIYIAIRRGPMKTPTSGTSVFSPNTSAGSTGTSITTNFPVDLQMAALRPGDAVNTTFSTRLTGVNTQNAAVLTPYLVSSSTAAETTGSVTRYWINSGFQMPGNFAGTDTIFWNFRRAPGFFDEVCYTGNSVNGRTVTHNLGVAPELMIVKNRTDADNWAVYAAPLGASKALYLNQTFAAITDSGQGWWGYPGVNPTATVFTLGNDGTTNSTPRNYVAYLFASCPGVSKVGSYTGTGATQTISCGFAARFVLIKRTNSTGSWFVWDTARGMVAGTDPRLALNSTAAETNADWVYTNASGFQIVTTDATVNASGGTYIYLCIA